MTDDKKWPGERAGMINLYTCEYAACRKKTVFILLDAGTTPFIITCPVCKNECTSSCYNIEVPKGTCRIKLEAEQAFFRPTKDWIEIHYPDLKEQWIDHLRNGGLAHAPIYTAIQNRFHIPFGGDADRFLKQIKEYYA
jgi:hypothetical protein